VLKKLKKCLKKNLEESLQTLKSKKHKLTLLLVVTSQELLKMREILLKKEKVK
jgi:hypothetical protein